MLSSMTFLVPSFSQYEEWNEHSQKLLGYIQTWNKPPIFYLPAQHNSETTELLKKTTAKIEGNTHTHLCTYIFMLKCSCPLQPQ